MKVKDLIEKLQNIKDKDALVVMTDSYGDLLFRETIDVYETKLKKDEILWDYGDDEPKWVPEGKFSAIVIEAN